jgi:hypothetical protein
MYEMMHRETIQLVKYKVLKADEVDLVWCPIGFACDYKEIAYKFIFFFQAFIILILLQFSIQIRAFIVLAMEWMLRVK